MGRSVKPVEASSLNVRPTLARLSPHTETCLIKLCFFEPPSDQQKTKMLRETRLALGKYALAVIEGDLLPLHPKFRLAAILRLMKHAKPLNDALAQLDPYSIRDLQEAGLAESDFYSMRRTFKDFAKAVQHAHEGLKKLQPRGAPPQRAYLLVADLLLIDAFNPFNPPGSKAHRTRGISFVKCALGSQRIQFPASIDRYIQLNRKWGNLRVKRTIK